MPAQAPDAAAADQTSGKPTQTPRTGTSADTDFRFLHQCIAFGELRRATEVRSSTALKSALVQLQRRFFRLLCAPIHTHVFGFVVIQDEMTICLQTATGFYYSGIISCADTNRYKLPLLLFKLARLSEIQLGSLLGGTGTLANDNRRQVSLPASVTQVVPAPVSGEASSPLTETFVTAELWQRTTGCGRSMSAFATSSRGNRPEGKGKGEGKAKEKAKAKAKGMGKDSEVPGALIICYTPEERSPHHDAARQAVRAAVEKAKSDELLDDPKWSGLKHLVVTEMAWRGELEFVPSFLLLPETADGVHAAIEPPSSDSAEEVQREDDVPAADAQQPDSEALAELSLESSSLPPPPPRKRHDKRMIEFSIMRQKLNPLGAEVDNVIKLTQIMCDVSEGELRHLSRARWGGHIADLQKSLPHLAVAALEVLARVNEIHEEHKPDGPAGYLHTDISANNIMLDEEGRAYLIDLDLAKPYTHGQDSAEVETAASVS